MIGACKSCGEQKELSAYQRNTGGRYYYRKFCIPCWSNERRSYQEEYREKNRVRLSEYDKKRHDLDRDVRTSASRRHYYKLKNTVLTHYGARCVCCGEDEIAFLALDHKENDGADHRRKIGIGHVFYRWIIDNNYPSSIQVLCNNCNIGKHKNGGSCPHDNAYKSQADFMVYTPYNTQIGI